MAREPCLTYFIVNPNKDLHKHLTPGSETLKVLHIGNIANNGYNIANLFNQAGVESDLIIGPYYHIAGCPEWEDAEFEGELGNQFYPAWHNVKITNEFSRPKWAAQGPWELCINYHLNRNKGNMLKAKLQWFWLGVCQRTAASDFANSNKLSQVLGSPNKVKHKIGSSIWEIKNNFYLTQYKFKNIIVSSLYHLKNGLYLIKYYSIRWLVRFIKKILLSNFLSSPLFYKIRNINRERLRKSEQNTEQNTEQNLQKSDVSEPDELESYRNLADQFKPLFEYYDVIIGYSTDGIWPLLAGKKYIAYEHGTIRTIPFQDDLQGLSLIHI